MDRALQLMGLHGGDSKKFSILNALITLSRTNDIGTVCLEKGIGAKKDITAAKYVRNSAYQYVSFGKVKVMICETSL